MKRLIGILAASIFALPLATLNAQSYTAQAGVTFFTSASAKVTGTSAAIRLPSFSGQGTLNITEAGITGSPSGCTITLAYQQNNSTTAGAVQSTTSFTPSTGVQYFAVTPTNPTGDNYVAVYACSSTYPTAGTLNVTFSPAGTDTQDPCLVSPKSSVAVAISTATTTQLVALTTGKKVYVCGFAATFGASTTLGLSYGTGSACGTGTTALTGVFAPGTGGFVSLNGEGTQTSTPVSNALCAVTTGTGGANGILTYVTQ